MSEKRRDSKNRILHNGEMQLADGRYRFKYLDHTGQVCYVYSWRLDKNDRAPEGRKRDISLRKKERQIQADMFDQTVVNFLKKDPLGKSGMNPKTLQYTMGHSDISVTLNTYTHVSFDDAQAEVERMKVG